MGRTIIRGNKALAKELGVSERTVVSWKTKRILDKGIIAQRSRVILYDLDKVLDCLKVQFRCSPCISDVVNG